MIASIFRSLRRALNVRLVSADEINRLRGTVDGIVRIKEIHANADETGTNMKAVIEENPAMSHLMLAALAHAIADCPNYTEFQFTPAARKGYDRITVTVQKVTGKTAHEARAAAELKLCNLQLAVRRAVLPMHPIVEWFTPSTQDSEVFMTGTAGRITLGDFRRVVALLKEGAAVPEEEGTVVSGPALAGFSICGIKMYKDMEYLRKTLLEENMDYAGVRVQLLLAVNRIEANLSTAIKAIRGEEAPKIEAK